MYLTLDAISATLATMAGCRAGTRVVLTYNQPPAALGGTTAQVAAAFAGIAAEMGEPFVSRFLPSQINQLLREHGFGEIANFGPHEARAAYFHGRADIDIAGAQRLIATTVMPAATPRRRQGSSASLSQADRAFGPGRAQQPRR
jgi:O-methyltransferase involved in polyketide biosynthesis